MPKKSDKSRPGLGEAVGNAPVKLRQKVVPPVIQAVQWTGTTQSATDIIDFVRDTNGYRRLVVFRPINTGGDVGLHLWNGQEYVNVPVLYHVCKGDRGYFIMSDRMLQERYEVIA